MTDEQHHPKTDIPRKPLGIVEWDEQWNEVAWQQVEDEIDRYRAAHREDMQQKTAQLDEFKRQAAEMEQQVQESPNDELAAALAQFKQLIAQADEALQAEEKTYRDTFDAHCHDVQWKVYADMQKAEH